MKKTVGVIAFIAAMFIGLLFGAEWLGLKWKGYFKPKHESIEREVFEETKSFVHGKQQFLAKAKREYDKCTDDICRKAIENTILQECPTINADSIQNEQLRVFLKKCRGY